MSENENIYNLFSTFDNIKIYIYIVLFASVIFLILFSYMKNKRFRNIISDEVNKSLKNITIRKINENEFEIIEKESGRDK